ncbi:MAG: hypothetical protein JWO06_154 [Bacteroidota bacterium]|nr:hypothetical protein [Bacteroidota bacterium]
MKKILQLAMLVVIFCLLFSCNQPGKKTDAAVGVYVDTLNYKGQNIYLEQIDSAAYLSLAKTHISVGSDTKDSAGVRQRDTIILYTIGKDTFKRAFKLITLKLENGDSVQMSFDMVTYAYAGQVRELNSWLLSGNDGDGDFYSLVNKKTGKESTLFRSHPVFSPDYKMLRCFEECNGTPDTGTSCISLCVYTIANNDYSLAWRVPLFKWRSEVVWKDNKTLYLRLEDARYAVGGPVYFVRLELPDFRK